MNKSTMKYEPELDGLRAIAVLGVIFFHLGIPFASGGFIGVDVFFVLSGYLITAIIWPQLQNDNFSFSDFYIRRARRLLPPLFAVIFLTTIASWFLLTPEHLMSFSRSAVHAALSFSNINFWLEAGYFDSYKYTKPLLHTWSLGVEAQFYLVWPLLLAPIVFAGSRWSQVTILFCVVVIGLCSNIAFVDRFPNAMFYLSPFRLWQFAAGGVVAVTLNAKHSGTSAAFIPRASDGILALLGLSIILYGFISVTPEGYPGSQALIPTLGAILVIVAGPSWLSRSILANPVSVYIGKISYSLYLTHWPIIVFWQYYTNSTLNAAEMASCVGLSFLSAIALNKFIEVPLRSPWTSNERAEKFAVTSGILVFLTCLVPLCVYPWIGNGLSWRLPQQGQVIVENMRKSETNHCIKRHLEGLGEQCIFGDSNQDVNLVLIGDSHAKALSRGMHYSLEKNGMTAVLLTLSGTLPFYGAITFDNQTPKPSNFDQWLEWTINSDADVIILHARFALHWLTERAEGERQGNKRKSVGMKGQAAPPSTKSSQQNFIALLNVTLDMLKNSEKEIVLVGAVPFQGSNLNSCINRPTYVMSVEHLLQTCNGYSRQQSTARVFAVNKLLKSAAQESGIHYVDPVEILCPMELPRCLRVVEESLLYEDAHHLSEKGASLIFDEVLRKIDLAN